MRHLSPAEWALLQFGSYGKLATALGVSRSAPWRWRSARPAGTWDPGDIPPSHMRRILAVALERQLDITEHDLLYGRDIADDGVVMGISVPSCTV